MQLLSAMHPALIAVCVVVPLVVLLIIVGVCISIRNGLISVRNDTEEAYSAMDVQMKKRYDLIPNLVETCKGYAKHESETFTRVTQARNNAIAAGPADKAAAEKELGSSLRMLINAVHEQYPELKANAQFNRLTATLEQIEEEIARSRKYYNAKVKLYNNKIEKIPSSFFARRMGLERKTYFELDDVSERVAPKVSFDDAPKTRL